MATKKLVIEIKVPEAASTEEIAEVVAKLAEAASELHAAYGGSGLLLEQVRVFTPSSQVEPE